MDALKSVLQKIIQQIEDYETNSDLDYEYVSGLTAAKKIVEDQIELEDKKKA